MKSIITALLFAFTFLFTSASAQQPRFVYIQTNDNQPFYVKLNNKIYSSSASGYLILSKLADSTYNLSIGFPKNEWPQQNISCVVNRKDLGFILKNFGDKGWGLFNLQTLDVVMANNSSTADKNIVKEERTDSFSNMLSAVVKDPTIKQTIVTKEVKLDTVQAPKNAETAVAETVTKEPAIASTPAVNTITRLLKKVNKDGAELVYIDNSNGQDTIRVFIPNGKKIMPVEKTEEEKKVLEEATESTASEQNDTQDKPSVNNVATNTNVQQPAINPITETSLPANNTTVVNVTTNRNCKSFATDEDFLKLRKKMASGGSNDNMINAAKKAFKAKCFKTGQIKNLSVLFLDDAGRYSFFDTSYPFVSDQENYNTLQSQLTDQYYINRFKALIQQ